MIMMERPAVGTKSGSVQPADAARSLASAFSHAAAQGPFEMTILI